MKMIPKAAQSHLQPPYTAAATNSWIPAASNRMPKMMPTRVTEACRNCKMTIEATLQRMPTTSHAHHHLASACRICRDSAASAAFGRFIGASIVLLALLWCRLWAGHAVDAYPVAVIEAVAWSVSL